MITQIIQDSYLWTGDEGIDVPTGTPVHFLAFDASPHPSYPGGIHTQRIEMAEVQLSDGRTGIVPAQSLGSGINTPEETLRGLEAVTGISYNTLAKAARDVPQRLLARKSGNHWLSTQRAVEYALERGELRAPTREE
jgi:hypothetical protein